MFFPVTIPISITLPVESTIMTVFLTSPGNHMAGSMIFPPCDLLHLGHVVYCLMTLSSVPLEIKALHCRALLSLQIRSYSKIEIISLSLCCVSRFINLFSMIILLLVAIDSNFPMRRGVMKSPPPSHYRNYTLAPKLTCAQGTT